LIEIEPISKALNHFTGVVAGLVPATQSVEGQSKIIEAAGHDREERRRAST
jgi:hypothetical protein